MSIRREGPGDVEAVRDALLAAMGPPEAELVERIRASDRYAPELALVAEEEGEIVGYVLLSAVDLEGGSEVLALAPVAVRPDRQRRGIGSALIREALGVAEGRGDPLVVVLGHADYYPRFGFEPARPLGILPPSDDIPDEVFMVRRLSGYDEALRGRLVYPPAFDVT